MRIAHTWRHVQKPDGSPNRAVHLGSHSQVFEMELQNAPVKVDV
jgi:hypothetical protein